MVSHRDTIFFAWSTRLPPHSVQLHFISKCLFRGQNFLPLEVAVHHDNDGFIVYAAGVPVICVPDLKTPEERFLKLTAAVCPSLDRVIPWLEGKAGR